MLVYLQLIHKTVGLDELEAVDLELDFGLTFDNNILVVYVEKDLLILCDQSDSVNETDLLRQVDLLLEH